MLLPRPLLLSSCQDCKGMTSAGNANQTKPIPFFFFTSVVYNQLFAECSTTHIVPLVWLVSPFVSLLVSTVKWSAGCSYFTVLSELSGPTQLSGQCRWQ